MEAGSLRAGFLDAKFQLPTKTRIDTPLGCLPGRLGIAGFRPGGALAALGTARIEAVAFVAALLVGVLAASAGLAITSRHVMPAASRN
jgi:hypothetical protein